MMRQMYDKMSVDITARCHERAFPTCKWCFLVGFILAVVGSSSVNGVVRGSSKALTRVAVKGRGLAAGAASLTRISIEPAVQV